MLTKLARVWVRRCLVVAGLMLPAGLVPASGAQTPNVILILVDDLGWADLGCQGSTYHETPNIDLLSAEGMRFTDAYAACAVCSPTRAAVLTGRYPARVGVTDWIRARFQGGNIPADGKNPTQYVGGPNQRVLCPPNPFWMEHEEVTIAEALKTAGYATCHIGKWHLGPDEWYPETQGFDLNIGGCDYGQPPSYFDPYEKPKQGDIPTLKPRITGEYLTDREGDEAQKFIREHKDKPFFLYLAHYAVHTPIQAKATLAAHFQNKPTTQQTNAQYAAMVKSVDESVGKVINTLEELRLSENTLVIFTSDNGGLDHGGNPAENSPLRSGKGYPYEGGIRVPLIVKWPGHVPATVLSSTPVCSIDYLPTILEATGQPLPEGRVIDGVSLLPHLTSGGRIPVERDALYWHFPHYRGQDIPPYSIIREGDWKLIKRYDGKRFELFNLAQDFREMNDLASIRPDKVLELNRQLEAKLADLGAKMPRDNPDYHPVLKAQKQKEGYLITEGGDKVLFYQTAPKSTPDGKYTRADYVHPLYDLDGNVLTEDFPADHLHHRGVFWAWHYLAIGDRELADMWTCKDIEWDVTHVETSPVDNGAALRLKARVLWKSPNWKDDAGALKPLVEETTLITVHPAAENDREIDFEISLLALEKDLHLGGSQDDKGYGGFSVRMLLPNDLAFTGPNGKVTPDRLAVEAGSWLDFTARFTEDAAVNGLAIFQHPANPGFPEKWVLRDKTSMQNPQFPGREPVELSTDTPLVLRYRLVIHRGDTRESGISKLQPAYEFRARRSAR